MFGIYLGIYIVLLIAIWGFFFVARHHTLKFKKFSTNITPVTNILFFLLIVLSISGLLSILLLGEDTEIIRINPSVETPENYY